MPFNKSDPTAYGVDLNNSSTSSTNSSGVASNKSTPPGMSRRSMRNIASTVPANEIRKNDSGVATDQSVPKPQSSDSNLILGKFTTKQVLGVSIVLVVLIVVVMIFNRPQEPVYTPAPLVSSEIDTPVMSEEERIRRELLDSGYGVRNSSDSPPLPQSHAGSDSFVKDLDGADISELWEAKTITYIQDYVSYTKHRAITDSGVEIYWLEGDYKGLTCRMNIKYRHFRTLADSGVVVCNIEIVETVNGNKLITWFSPIEDPIGSVFK